MKFKRSEQGFTLLEAILAFSVLAVLMIMAFPRYVDLIEKAKVKVIQYVMGIGCENVTMIYSREILLTSKPPSMDRLYEILNDKNAEYTKIGVFTINYTNADNKGIKVIVTGSSIFEMPTTDGPFEKTIVLVPDG